MHCNPADRYGMRSMKNTARDGLLAGLVLSLLAAAPSSAETSLTPHKAAYKVKISVLSGRLTTELRANEDGYEAIHQVEPTGLADVFTDGKIVETSAFRRIGDGLLPEHYTSVDEITKDKTRADVRFDWDLNVMAGMINGQAVEESLGGLMHDRVSIQYELMQDLKSGGSDTEYLLFDIDELKPLLVRHVGAKQVKVPAGRYDVVGVSHQGQGSKRVTTLWCAPELDYLPVLIEQHRKGKLNFRAVLTHYEPTAG